MVHQQSWCFEVTSHLLVPSVEESWKVHLQLRSGSEHLECGDSDLLRASSCSQCCFGDATVEHRGVEGLASDVTCSSELNMLVCRKLTSHGDRFYVYLLALLPLLTLARSMEKSSDHLHTLLFQHRKLWMEPGPELKASCHPYSASHLLLLTYTSGTDSIRNKEWGKSEKTILHAWCLRHGHLFFFFSALSTYFMVKSVHWIWFIRCSELFFLVSHIIYFHRSYCQDNVWWRDHWAEEHEHLNMRRKGTKCTFKCPVTPAVNELMNHASSDAYSYF